MKTEVEKKWQWYHGVKGVNSRGTNKRIGLNLIKAFPASEKQLDVGIVGSALLYLNGVTVRVAVGLTKNGEGLHVIPPGINKVGDTYFENVQLSYEVKAQVLLFFEKYLLDTIK